MDILQEVGSRLGVLASRGAQELYMVHATRDEYLLIDEAVENALGLESPRFLTRMDHRTQAAVSDFLLVLHAERVNLDALPSMPWDEKVLENQPLKAIRSAASKCLSQIGFDLAQWEREEGYSA